MTTVLLAGVLFLAAFTQAQPAKKPHGPAHVQPFERLFVTKPLGTVQVDKAPWTFAPAVKQHDQAERGPCNMPVIRANPEVDQKMVQPITKTGAKIRVIEPPVCWQK